VVAERCDSRAWETLPLALNPEGCIFRAHALSALGRATRRWELHYVSPSPTGINLAVQAGLALTVKTPRSVPKGCRIVGAAEGLPPLDQVEVELHRRPAPSGEALAAFCQELERLVGGHAGVATPQPHLAP